MSKNITTFVDQIGRVIIGETVEDTKDKLKVKNPAIIHIGQNPQTGQLQVQTIPYFFREFIAQSQQKEGSTWTFLKNNIVVGETEIDERLIEQYDRLSSATVTSAPVPATATGTQKPNKAEVIKLFDDEK